MSFLYSSLLWIGLPLIGLPLLIHLINMLRHRRVQWAAMEFLLQSQRKHRTWIILKQLLLLLLRTAAVAAVVLMVAQPVLRGQWGSLIGGAKTHHIVLLDDSFSMSDRWADTSAFDEAKSVVSRLAGLAGRQDSAQTFTLLRFSRASRLAKGTQPDLLQKSLDAEFSTLLTSTLSGMQPSETAAGPNDVLEAIDRLPSKAEDENRVVYLVSDFRAIQWDDPVVLRKTLSRLDESGTQVRLVNCVEVARPNVAISSLRAGPGTRAAGVPLMMEVAVKNFGTTVAKDVSVALSEDGSARPAVVFEEIPPGRAATRRFPVQFSTAGEHQIAASLQSDAVAADNERHAVIDFPAAVSVLVIDGDPKAQDAYFLTSALSPGGKINSGLKALVETPRYLRNHDLSGFAAVYLLNLERLDPAEIQVLEDYARAGGGVAFFLGELSRGEFFTKSLYRDGAGLFPLPLTQSTQLLVDRLDKAPDLEVTVHPIFSVFAGERNSFINTVTVERYFGAPKDWAPDPESTTKVIAKLRNGAPLAVERKFGEGRVVALLTKAAPVNTSQGVWNNWGRNNPSFVVAMLELQAYLSAPGQADTSRLVVAPLEVEFSAARYQPVVRFVMPQEKQGGAPSIDASAAHQSEPSKLDGVREKDAKDSPPKAGELIATLTDTDTSGIYEAQLTATSGTPESRRFAYNVEPEEGDLRVLDGQQLATRLAGIRYQYQLAKDLNYDPQQLAGFNLGESMLYVLVAILLGEQVISYFMSYHPPRPPEDNCMIANALAPLLGADTISRTTFELGRLQNYTERWQYLVLGLVCAAILAFVVYMYRRDSVELRRGVGPLLLLLRVVALLGVLAYYLDLEKRTERRVVHNSRVLVLVDSSLSMGLHDTDSSAVPQSPTRLEQVVSVLDQGKLLERLQEKHEVVLLRFDADSSRILALAKLPPAGVNATPTVPSGDGSETNHPSTPDKEAKPTDSKPLEWQKLLVPQGSETRIGQTLRQVINDERQSPVAGLVLFSDGQQNSGVDTSAAVALARESKIPIYTVGIGSNRRPANVRVSDLVAPARAYPGDSFTVTGYIQSQELSGRTVTVELISSAGGKDGGEGKVEGTERVTLGGRGEIMPVKFELSPQQTGRRTLRLRVKPPTEDSDPTDNQQEVDVEIVDRKTKVLLIASGPTREYIFLRNQLRRDKSMVVDVWLQSAKSGISQDANKILDEFPASPQELFEYDAIVAFDPDWQALDATAMDNLERWVAEKAGGLIVLAGPVEMDQWVQDAKLSKIRGLYPVEFNRRLAMLEDGRFGSERAAAIDFTREGVEAEYLWLADTGPQSQQIWTSFPGVYGYYSVRNAKPGATVFARYSDPEASVGGEQPVYMAGQFYGSGRVFYLGSGEMWRLRALDDSYFEQIYTKLIRHVSQGRLLVGSSRGLLLVDRDRYQLGSTVLVRAQLSNPQFDPLDLPSVSLQVVRPDGTVDTMQLVVDPARKGMFAGQFTALQEGTYRLELEVPESDGEQLARRIQVKVPELERENPERNDSLLSELAQRTGGLYYVGADAVLGQKGAPPLVNQLDSRDKVTYLPGILDREFDQSWMRGLLLVICGALSLEWLIRRLSRLA